VTVKVAEDDVAVAAEDEDVEVMVKVFVNVPELDVMITGPFDTDVELTAVAIEVSAVDVEAPVVATSVKDEVSTMIPVVARVVSAGLMVFNVIGEELG